MSKSSFPLVADVSQRIFSGGIQKNSTLVNSGDAMIFVNDAINFNILNSGSLKKRYGIYRTCELNIDYFQTFNVVDSHGICFTFVFSDVAVHIAKDGYYEGYVTLNDINDTLTKIHVSQFGSGFLICHQTFKPILIFKNKDNVWVRDDIDTIYVGGPYQELSGDLITIRNPLLANSERLFYEETIEIHYQLSGLFKSQDVGKWLSLLPTQIWQKQQVPPYNFINCMIVAGEKWSVASDDYYIEAIPAKADIKVPEGINISFIKRSMGTDTKNVNLADITLEIGNHQISFGLQSFVRLSSANLGIDFELSGSFRSNLAYKRVYDNVRILLNSQCNLSTGKIGGALAITSESILDQTGDHWDAACSTNSDMVYANLATNDGKTVIDDFGIAPEISPPTLDSSASFVNVAAQIDVVRFTPTFIANGRKYYNTTWTITYENRSYELNTYSLYFNGNVYIKRFYIDINNKRLWFYERNNLLTLQIQSLSSTTEETVNIAQSDDMVRNNGNSISIQLDNDPANLQLVKTIDREESFSEVTEAPGWWDDGEISYVNFKSTNIALCRYNCLDMPFNFNGKALKISIDSSIDSIFPLQVSSPQVQRNYPYRILTDKYINISNILPFCGGIVVENVATSTKHILSQCYLHFEAVSNFDAGNLRCDFLYSHDNDDSSDWNYSYFGLTRIFNKTYITNFKVTLICDKTELQKAADGVDIFNPGSSELIFGEIEDKSYRYKNTFSIPLSEDTSKKIMALTADEIANTTGTIGGSIECEVLSRNKLATRRIFTDEDLRHYRFNNIYFKNTGQARVNNAICGYLDTTGAAISTASNVIGKYSLFGTGGLLKDYDIAQFRLGVFGSGNYPTASCVYGGRLWLASSSNDSRGIYGSEFDSLRNFDPFADGVLTDTSPTSTLINSNASISDLRAGKGLFVRSGNSVFIVFGTEAAPTSVSPTTISVELVTQNCGGAFSVSDAYILYVGLDGKSLYLSDIDQVNLTEDRTKTIVFISDTAIASITKKFATSGFDLATKDGAHFNLAYCDALKGYGAAKNIFSDCDGFVPAHSVEISGGSLLILNKGDFKIKFFKQSEGVYLDDFQTIDALDYIEQQNGTIELLCK